MLFRQSLQSMFSLKKKTNRSPGEIRHAIADITGLSLKGVVQLAPPEVRRASAGDAYAIGHGDGFLMCVLGRDGWDVALSSDREGVAQNWSTRQENTPPD